MSKIKKDQILGLIGLIFAAFVIFNTMKLKATAFVGDPGPKMFPFLASALIAVCSLILIVKPDKKTGEFLTMKQWLRVWGLFAVYVSNFVIMWLLGFNFAVPYMLFVCTFIFSRESNKEASLKSRILKSLIYAAVGFAVLYLLYVTGLNAQLPKGIIWKMIK